MEYDWLGDLPKLCVPLVAGLHSFLGLGSDATGSSSDGVGSNSDGNSYEEVCASYLASQANKPSRGTKAESLTRFQEGVLESSYVSMDLIPRLIDPALFRHELSSGRDKRDKVDKGDKVDSSAVVR
jgi:hypothetical protein